MSSDPDRSPSQAGPRIAAALLVVLGLVVAAGGIGVVRDSCEVACGTAADQRLRDGLGYAGAFLGTLAVGLVVVGRRWIALGAAALGAICELTALLEGLSHLR